MRKFKLNKDFQDKTPSKEQTNSYKDFAQLSHAYDKATKRPKKPLYKDPKAFIALVLIVIVVWLVVEAQKEEDNSKKPHPTENTDNSNQ